MQQPTPPRLLRVAPHVVSRVVQGRALVLDHERDEIQQLNAVGSHVWALLSSRPRAAHELAEEVAREFEVELADAARDIDCFVRDLLARGLVVADPSPAP